MPSVTDLQHCHCGVSDVVAADAHFHQRTTNNPSERVLKSSTQQLFDRYYFRRTGFRNGTETFHALCKNTIAENSTLLEVGAGPSNNTSDFLSRLGRLEGVDVANEVTSNRALQAAHVYDGQVLPFSSNRFDACVSNYVLEHITNPQQHFIEVSRVLKPDGVYVFRTPNLLSYVSLASAALPHAVHKILANRLRGLGPDSHEPWRTVYRANTVSTLSRLASRASMQLELVQLIEREPSYGRASALLFYPMMVWERILNSSDRFSWMRSTILGVMRKNTRQ